MEEEEPPTKKRKLTFKRSFHGTNAEQTISAQQKEQAAQGFLPRPGKTALKKFRKARRAAEAEKKAERTLGVAEDDSGASDAEEAESQDGSDSEDIDGAMSDAQTDSNDSDPDTEDHEPADTTESTDASKPTNPNVSHGEVSNDVPGEALPLSKNQLKKLRKKEAWEAGRADRKLVRKQKIAEKRVRQREAKAEARVAAKSSGKAAPKPPARRRHVLLPVAFVIDCGFDDLMMEKERMSLGQQVTRCYSDNHKAPFQAHLYVSSWGGILKERFETVLEKHYYNWKGVKFTENDFVVAAEWADKHMRAKDGGKLAGAFASEVSKAPIMQAENALEPQEDEVKAVDATDTMLSVEEAGTIATTALQDNSLPHGNKEKEPDLGNAPTKKQQGANDSNEQAQPPAEAATTPNLQSRSLPPVPNSPQRHDTTPPGPSPPEPGEVIYLTSDSPHTLDRLKPYSTYIIGGLVDKNRHKGLCYKTACDKGVKTAKLPIGEYMEMQSRFVLATNHVVEIMIRWLECGDWGEAFMKVVPKRKGGRLKRSGDGVGLGDGEDERGVDVEDRDNK